MKKFTILLLALLLVIPAMAVTMTGGEVLYLKADGSTKWSSDNARFAAYFFGNGNTWVSMTKVDGETAAIYEVTVPKGSWTNVIFCRMNPNSSSNGWSNKWNQSGDLVYDGKKNLFTPSGWDNATTTWSVYTPPVIETPNIKSFTVSPTTVLLGGEITLSSSIENSTDAVVYSVDGQTITSPWTPTEAGIYTITASLNGAESKTATVEVIEIPEGVVFYEGEIAAFFINSENWTSVKAHVWNEGGSGTTWPGLTCDLAGGNFYKWTGSGDWKENAPEKIIFNNNNGSQTPDMTFENGAVYTTSGEIIGYIEPTKVEEPTISLSYSPTEIYVGDVVTFTSNVLHGDGLTVEYYVGEEKLAGDTWTATAAGEFTATAKLMNGTTVVTTDSKTFTVAESTEFYAYLMKDGAWDPSYIYYWGDAGNTWPGTQLSETETIEGVEYYKTTFRNVETVNIIFNGGDGKPQTSNIEGVTSTKYYRITNQEGGEGSYEASETPFVVEQPETLVFTVTVPVGTENCYIIGNFAGSDWATPLAMTAISDIQYTITIDSLVKSSVRYKYLTNAEANADDIWKNEEVADENDGHVDSRSYKENDEVVKWRGINLYYEENIVCETLWYLDANNLWNADNAWFAAYFYNRNTSAYTWVKGELLETGYYTFYLSQYNVPENAVARAKVEDASVYTHVIFCRMNPEFDVMAWDETEEVENGDGTTTTNVTADRVWNQTADLTYNGTESNALSTFQITDADGNGTWINLPTAIEGVEATNGIGYAYGIVSAEGAIEVYNIGGVVVARGNDNVDLRGLNGGIYIVRNGNNVRKVVR